jgi:hypothetical protein
MINNQTISLEQEWIFEEVETVEDKAWKIYHLLRECKADITHCFLHSKVEKILFEECWSIHHFVNYNLLDSFLTELRQYVFSENVSKENTMNLLQTFVEKSKNYAK